MKVSPGRKGVALMASSSRSMNSFFIQVVVNEDVNVNGRCNVQGDEEGELDER